MEIDTINTEKKNSVEMEEEKKQSKSDSQKKQQKDFRALKNRHFPTVIRHLLAATKVFLEKEKV